MPTDSQDKLAHCRGVRRMHLRSNAPACVRAPGSHIRFICAWLIATRKLSVLWRQLMQLKYSLNGELDNQALYLLYFV